MNIGHEIVGSFCYQEQWVSQYERERMDYGLKLSSMTTTSDRIESDIPTIQFEIDHLDGKAAMLRNKILLSIISTLVLLLLLEGIGRWLIPNPPANQEGFVSDAELGWPLPVGQTMMWRGVQAQINSLGLRSPEPTAKKNKVLIVGDSSVFGDGVSDRNTMSSQLERILGTEYSVQNGGTPGFTCLQSQILYNRIVKHYQPDILIVYNFHSDYRRVEAHDILMPKDLPTVLKGTGLGKTLSAGMLWLRILRGRPNLEVEDYQSCLENLSHQHRKIGTKVLYLWPITGVDFEDHELYGEEDPSPKGLRIKDYREAMSKAALVTKSVFLDGPSIVKGANLNRKTALLDEVHPSIKGHQALAKGLADAILKKDQ